MYGGAATRTASLIGIIVAGLLVASCATSIPAAENNNNVGSLADSANDPNRIVCKSYKPAASQRDEKICMTAGQWDKKDGETK